MLHKEIFGLTILGFLLWIVFSSDPSERITRTCKPVAWVGNAATSVAALTSPTYQRSVDGWFKGLDYGCRYSVWRMFYQEEYSAWEQDNKDPGEAESTEDTPAKDGAAKGDKGQTTDKTEGL